MGSWRSWWLPPPHQSPTHLLMPSPLPTEFRLPKPVLSVLPGHEVVAGSYVTFRCTIAHSSAGCFLYLEGQIKTLSLLSNEQDDFNLSHVHKGNGGRYSCQCFTKGASFEWSAVSKTLDLVVRGETSPQPHPALLFLPGWRLSHPGGTRKEDVGEERSCNSSSSRGLQLPSDVFEPCQLLRDPTDDLQTQACYATSWGARVRGHLCLHLPAPGTVVHPVAAQWHRLAGSGK